MVIKDLLSKVSKPQQKADDPKVKALREKLSKLQGSKEPAQSPQSATDSPPKQETLKAEAPQKKSDSEMERLANASMEEQRRFAQQEDPRMKLKEERTQKLMAKQIGEMIELNGAMEKRLKQLEQERVVSKRENEQMMKRAEEIEKKMQLIDQRLEKFMGLYEVITNQYNPFLDDKEKRAMPPPEAPAKIKLSDSMKGTDEEVPIKPGVMSSENAKRMQDLLAELERDEQEKRNVEDKDEEEAIAVREDERTQDVMSEMHKMFSSFEERLKTHLDSTVEEKLHGTLSQLENVLNEEIKAAVKDEMDVLKSNDSIIEGALKELEELESQADDQDAFKQDISQVEEEFHRVDDQIKAIPPNLYFRLADGRVLKSKDDLTLALQTMPEQVFAHHVKGDRNDFASWLELALNDPQGNELRGKSQQEMVSALSK